MGYETKLIIGKKYIGTDNAFDAHALIKLSSVGEEVGDLINILFRKESEKKYPRTYYYNKQLKKIKKDECGDELRLVPIQEILDALITDNSKEPTRRFSKAISLVKQFIKEFGEGNTFGILYGY